ncbi:MAG: glycosyltransferase family 4 protein [Acetatifactor sp.]|nr:glycosyltransferase family 4 protein [Acetatifactor sp.]
MLKNKYKVTVCLPHIDSEVGIELGKEEGVDVVAFNHEIAMISAYNGGPKWYSRTFWRNIFRISQSKQILEKIIAENNYDLVMLNSITLSWMSKFFYERGIKNVCYIRETRINNIGFLLSKHLLESYCDGILFISEFDKSDVNLKVSKQSVIHDVVEFDGVYTNIYKIPEDKYVIAYLGGNEYIKGYPTVRELLKLAEDQDLFFVVAGHVAPDEYVFGENVMYVGNVRDVGDVLSVSNLLIFPALVGHQARPVFEAGAFRLPVIVSNFPQTQESIINGSTGYIFEPGNAEDLLDKIKMVKKENVDNIMGRKNYELYMRKHSITSCKQRLIDFFEEVICKS